MQVELFVNGQQRSDDVEPRLLLVHYLREVCGLRAANVGCDTTSCGACTVLLNGTSVKSCTVLAVQAAGQQVTTAEGLAADGELHPVQAAFRQEHGLQCGFCTPGMVMAAVGLHGQNRAGLHRLAVEQHRARPAGRGVAPDVRGAQAADLAQIVNEQQPWLDLVAARGPVDRELDLHAWVRPPSNH